MRYDDDGPWHSPDSRILDEPSPPLAIATVLRGDGITGVDTHIRQVRRFLDDCGQASTLVTPFSWGRLGNLVAPWPARPELEPHGDLVAIGNLDLVKNHRFLLEVLAEAKRAGRSFSLDICGNGPCQKDLSRQARSLGLEEQVHFRGFRTEVRDFLSGYRAYVHASYSESSSLVIMEAMAAGLPIVAADIGSISELCDEGVEARFWPLDDPARAAAILIDLLDNEHTRLKAAHAARERFRHDCDAAVVPRTAVLLDGDRPTTSAREESMR